MTREIAGLTGRGESENETTEVTPDTDTDSADQMHKHAHGGSFKRPAPVMGNRSLETRNSKRSQSNPQQQQQQQNQSRKESNAVPLSSNSVNNPSSPNNSTHAIPTSPAVTVGALEVQNVKRAINRYGTLPKGARIGAYLESLRQTSDNGTAIASPRPQNKETIITNEPLVELPPPSPAASALNNNSLGHSMSPRAVVKSQPQMIRSNSSGGVTMTNSATQSLNKLQRHRTTTDGSMITFSSFRGTSGSPKRAINPTLADLEFPPPPSDLPPPPEEFESSADIETTSTRSTLDTMQLSQSASLAPSTDVSNTEPSVEEASSRFGVSLRKREPSTDSCSSLGSPATGNANEITADTNLSNSNDKTKSMSELNEKTNENSQKKIILNDVPNSRTTNNNHHTRNDKNVDHISQLVNELAESMNLPKTYSAELANRKTTSSSPVVVAAVATPAKIETNGLTNANNFKAQLKKVDPKKIYQATSKEEATNPIVDFKSRLRRVDNSNENEPTESTLECKKIVDANDNNSRNQGQLVTDEHDSDQSNNFRKNSIKMLKKNGDHDKKKSHADAVDQPKKTDAKQLGDDEKTKALAADANETKDDDDKRKSTGSISSLKKIWETKESSNTSTGGGFGSSTNETAGFSQVSPKCTSKSVIGGNGSSNNNNNKNSGGSGDDYDDHILTANKKPAVPTKPTKLASIYATPIQVKLNADPIVTGAIAPPMVVPMQIKRETILELIQLLETSLKNPSTSITASQWLQLSDKLNILQNSCVSFADTSTMAPHSKFQFRELVTRIECQSRSLRSAGNKNVQDNEKLIQECGQTLKQITNTLHR